MGRSIYRRYVYLFVFALLAAPASAAGQTAENADKADKKEEQKPAAAAPAAETVKKGPFRIVVELEGVFEGEDAREISVAPDEWSKLTVQKAAAHGARVRKGDVVLELETEKLDREIADLRDELKLSATAIVLAQERLQALEKSAPISLDAARRSAKIADEDRRFFFDVAKPFQLKIVEFLLKNARNNLEYQEEELRQLEKMYKADDITEETEEIVLQRARNTLEQAKISLEMALVNHDYALKYALPRREVDIVEAAKQAKLNLENIEAELPPALDKQRLELEKMRQDRNKSEERLEKLLADREKMTVRSPADGVVYYGRLNRGKPADSAGLEDALRPRGTIPPNQVVMTVVSPRPLRVRTTVPEKDLHDLRPGLKGSAVPKGYPDLDLPVEIDRVADIPTAPGEFDGWLRVQLKDRAKLLMPGMTCRIKLVPYLKRDAILIPPKSLVADELDDNKQSVQVLGKDGKIETRPVTVGRKTDKQVEILKGLSEGDKVVLEPSKDKD